jgi:hypothetical protein
MRRRRRRDGVQQAERPCGTARTAAQTLSAWPGAAGCAAPRCEKSRETSLHGWGGSKISPAWSGSGGQCCHACLVHLAYRGARHARPARGTELQGRCAHAQPRAAIGRWRYATAPVPGPALPLTTPGSAGRPRPAGARSPGGGCATGGGAADKERERLSRGRGLWPRGGLFAHLCSALAARARQGARAAYTGSGGCRPPGPAS